MAAPCAAQLLADLGADVIKVERPGHGDELRHYGPVWLDDQDGNTTLDSSYFLSFNRNKRSIEIDLAQEAGVATLRALAAQADVLIENFKVGTLARRGLDEATLRAANPRLIYCSITGFGQTGPHAARGGVDNVFQSMSGLMSLTGEPDGAPQRAPVVVIDILTGLYAANAVQAALIERATTGTGAYIDIALMDVGLSLMSHRAMEYMMSGKLPDRLGNAASGAVPAQVFKCRDGYISVQAGSDRQFPLLCTALGAPELATDPRFAVRADRVANRHALLPIIEAVFVTRGMAEWLDVLAANDVMCSPINTVAQALAHPQVVHRQMQVSVEHPTGQTIPLLANPIRFADHDLAYRAPPRLGQHTEEILRELAQRGTGGTPP